MVCNGFQRGYGADTAVVFDWNPWSSLV